MLCFKPIKPNVEENQEMLNTIEYFDIINQLQEPKLVINSSSSTQSEPIKETGIYRVWWDVGCYMLVDSKVGTVVTSENGIEMPVPGAIPMRLHKGSIITGKCISAASGTIRLIRVGGG